MQIELIKILAEHSWNIEKNLVQPNIKISSFQKLPLALQDILLNYKTVSNPSDVAWFFTFAEINGETESEFKWDELKNQSLDAAIDDSQINSINTFWNNHFLFIMSVKDGYSYLAICTNGENKNKIVFGYEPEYEEIEVLFDSFDEFSIKFTSYLKGDYKSDVFDRIF